jgi:hypothetical protein
LREFLADRPSATSDRISSNAAHSAITPSFRLGAGIGLIDLVWDMCLPGEPERERDKAQRAGATAAMHLRRFALFGGECSSWQLDCDAGAAEVDEGDEGAAE